MISTFDVNRKCAFKMEHGNQPQPLVNQEETVNSKEFWDNINKHAISQNSTSSVQISPTHSYWAPYVGEHSRSENSQVFNTEFLKGSHDDSEQEFLECLSEDTLETLLDKDAATLRELCIQCGIAAKNMSRLNCIQRLKTALKENVKIDKFFFKIWNSSGGLLTGTCPHGVVYCFKSLLSPESPRDIGDVLLSMRFPPTIVISDIPHMLASHMNKRKERLFFPHAGRVAEATDENVKLAEVNNFQPVSFPFLNARMEKAVQPSINSVNKLDAHPVTKVTWRLSLYDKFHEGNTSQKKEYLRRTGYIQELDGVVTETAEQLNSFLSKSLYFLDCLSPATHLLMIKSLFALRNSSINAKLIGSKSMNFDVLGRMILVEDGVPQSSHTSGSYAYRSDNLSSSLESLPAVQGSFIAPSLMADNIIETHNANICKDSKRIKLDNKQNFSAQDKVFFDCVKLLYQGLPNPSNNCWFNASITALRNTYGASRFYEDVSLINQSDGVDGYFELFKPILGSFDIRSSDVVGRDEVSQCLQSYFDEVTTGIKIGEQQDPLDFFLQSLGIADSYMMLSVFGVFVQTYYVCLKCPHTSNNNEREILLSLSLPDHGQSSMLDLLDKYFEDESSVKLNCESCDSTEAGAARKITSAPHVFAIQIKRYDRIFGKSDKVVYLDRELDIAPFSECISNNTAYTLRAIICHKGSSMDSGHFTTFLFEDVKNIFMEIDGTRILLPNDLTDLYSGGYLLLYENKTIINELIDKWFPMSLFLYSLLCLSHLDVSALEKFVSKFKIVIDSYSGDLETITPILVAFASKLARHYSSELSDVKSNEDILKFLSRTFGVNDCKCYFLGCYTCEECSSYQACCRIFYCDMLRDICCFNFKESC